ncbi:mavicyanin-like [Momordica charantia]|uniref:Mavicyanin-like n=1 Tax=Momordica charantia TaxID=3673 RepID=A0A6J1DXY6_MOMCH|nr:mavicyanin-like [Momordica charantia]
MVSWKMWWAMWIIGLFAVSVGAAVHKVGDSAGWTTLIPVDYAKWASSNNFHVGDSLLFSYNNKFHNVLQVNQQQYGSCNSSSPAASYNSGADSIALKRTGTFYFLCGFPGHCQEGQKVEIKVTRASSSAALALSPGPSPSPSPLPNGPAPTPSAASTRSPHHLPLLLLLLLPAFIVAFYHLFV